MGVFEEGLICEICLIERCANNPRNCYYSIYKIQAYKKTSPLIGGLVANIFLHSNHLWIDLSKFYNMISTFEKFLEP